MLFRSVVSYYSQTIKINSEKNIIVDTVVTLDTIKANIIYDAIKKWAQTNFNNVKEVTVLDSPSEIQFRFIKKLSNGIGDVPYKITLNIKIKDAKMRLEYSNMSWAEGGTSFESVYIKNDGTLRDNKPSKNTFKACEASLKENVIGISKNIYSKPNDW